MNEDVEYRQLTRDELNKLAGEELPERAALALIRANIAVPVHAAIALYGNYAEQDVEITQSP